MKTIAAKHSSVTNAAERCVLRMVGLLLYDDIFRGFFCTANLGRSRPLIILLVDTNIFGSKIKARRWPIGESDKTIAADES